MEDPLERPDDPPFMQGKDRLKFKDLDGVYKVADLPLPGVLKLPTGCWVTSVGNVEHQGIPSANRRG